MKPLKKESPFNSNTPNHWIQSPNPSINTYNRELKKPYHSSVQPLKYKINKELIKPDN
jgi:hypothetical protein